MVFTLPMNDMSSPDTGTGSTGLASDMYHDPLVDQNHPTDRRKLKAIVSRKARSKALTNGH